MQTDGRGFVVTPVIMFVQIVREFNTAIYRGLISCSIFHFVCVPGGICHQFHSGTVRTEWLPVNKQSPTVPYSCNSAQVNVINLYCITVLLLTGT